MSKEVQVVAWCDGEHDERVPATVERRGPLDGETYLLDLCERCDRAYARAWAQVQEWLARGVSEGRARKSPYPKNRAPRGQGTTPPPSPEFDTPFMRTCQEPDCIDERTGVRYVAPTRSALGQHVKVKHDNKRLADYDWSSP